MTFPTGAITTQEEIYVEGSPEVYIQDYLADELHNPDANGYYWNLASTPQYPVDSLGCIRDVSLSEGLTMQDVVCDAFGVKDTIQRRDYIEFNITVASLFPLNSMSKLMNLSPATVSSGTETVGIGAINNNKRYHVYMPRVYDTDAGDYVVIHLHKAKFVDAWTVNMPGGQEWNVTGLKIRAYADTTKPANQRFGVIHRIDASALPVLSPTITSITPNTGAEAGGTSVTITGTNLTGATSVTFGGVAATSVVVVSSTSITCVTPAHAAGAVDVAVTTAGGTATSVGGFTYVV